MTDYTANIMHDEVIILTAADVAGQQDYIVSYPLNTNADPVAVLRDKGWFVRYEIDESAGYGIVVAEPRDWEQIVEDVTCARTQAQIEADRQDVAWRAVIRDGMHDDTTNKTRLAEAAGVTRDRMYQIRDARR